MSWLTVRYSPGFQEDLTSWLLSIQRDGQTVQEVDVCRFTPFEKQKETHRFQLSANELAALAKQVSALKFAEIEDAANHDVVDDTERIQVSVNHGGRVESFAAPLAYWSWQRAKGLPLETSVCSAVAFWAVLLPLSKYGGRNATGA